MVKMAPSVCVAVIVVFFSSCVHACDIELCESAENATMDTVFTTSENISVSDYPEANIRMALTNSSLDFSVIQSALDDAVGTQSVAPCLPYQPMFPPAAPAALFVKRILKGHVEDLINKLQCPMVPARLLMIDNYWVVGRVPFAVCPGHHCCTVDWRYGVCRPVKHVWVCLIAIRPINDWEWYEIKAFWVLLPVSCGCEC